MVAAQGDTVRMDEVAKRSGVGLGTLCRHFPTKAALLAAVVARRFEGMTELVRVAASIDEPGEAFQALVYTCREAADQDAGFGSPCSDTSNSIGPTSPRRSVANRRRVRPGRQRDTPARDARC